MPNAKTVRALISAFNVYNYGRNTVETNFTLQSDGKKNYIVVSFGKSMDTCQCRRYLDSIKRKIIREFYGIEESNGAEILDTAKLIFDVNSFPFYISDRDWSWDEQHRLKFVTPVDEGVIFNLKSHLASSLKKDVLEGMPTCSIFTNAFDKKKYLWRGEFPNKKLRKEFEHEFLSRMKERYENVPKNPLKVEGNDVYIKDVFNDARFIDSVTRRVAWLVGMDLGVGNDVDRRVQLFRSMVIRSIYQIVKVTIDGFVSAPPLDRTEASILTPIMQNGKGIELLTREDAQAINDRFNNSVLGDISGKTQATLKVNGSSGIYGIDFSNPYISHCVITKIIENSVINKDHELSIDPELRFRALSRSPSTEMSGMKLESPRQGWEKFPVLPPVNQLGVPGTSKEFPPRSHLNSIAVSYGISAPSSSSQSLSAAENVQAGTSDSSLWSSQTTHENTWMPSLQFPGPELSAWTEGPCSSQSSNVITPPIYYGIPTKPILLTTNNDRKSSSREFSARSPCFEDVNILGMKSEEHDKSEQGACSQVSVRESSPLEGAQADDESMPIDSWSSPASSAELRQQSQVSSSGPSSSRGANESMRTGKSIWYVPLSHSPGVEDVNDVELEKQQVSESPKKHGGRTILNKILSPFKRNNKNRSSTSSSVSAPEGFVTEKPPLSKRSASERRAKSNPPSKVTSPTHEGAPGGLKPLTSDERKELRPFLSPELQKKLDSNSFSPGEERHLYLTHTLSGKRELSRSLCEGKESQLLRLAEAQLSSLDNSSSKKVDRDSGFCSMGSPAVPHKGSVSSKVKECDLQQAKYMSKALGKN